MIFRRKPARFGLSFTIFASRNLTHSLANPILSLNCGPGFLLAYYAAFEFKYGRKDFADCLGAIDNLSPSIYANVLENYGKFGN